MRRTVIHCTLIAAAFGVFAPSATLAQDRPAAEAREQRGQAPSIERFMKIRAPNSPTSSATTGTSTR